MSDERDYEKEALADGWNPNYEGDNKVDAKTFVERGEKINGMLKGKIGRLEERIESLTQTNAEFKQFTDKQREKDANERKKLIEELEQVRAQAITDGDGPAAIKAERDIKEIESSAPQIEPGVEEYNRIASKWAEENKWYAESPKLRIYANGLADELNAMGYFGQAYFDEMTRRVKADHPEEFENPNKLKPGTVEAGGAKEVKDSKAKTWANLPAADKAAAERFIKDIPGFTKEDYIAQYDWD